MSKTGLVELDELLRIVAIAPERFDLREWDTVDDGGTRYPLLCATLGASRPDAPAMGFFGGVHGLERIGARVVLAFMASLAERLGRDPELEDVLARTRIVFMPVINPAGMSRGTRANANGVDLMRNAPVDGADRVTLLVGGQRLTARLPWYRGPTGAPMERESRALCDVVRAELLSRPFSIALDCHSGFGLRDRVWFPWAHSRAPFPRLAEVHALLHRFRSAYPHAPYVFEPQSRRYRTHGDLWDYLCLAPDAGDDGLFIPLTLEMGSWRWIRKNPRQVLSRIGLFNPFPPERARRVERNHLDWFEFLCAATRDHGAWVPRGDARSRHQAAALAAWFGGAA